MTLNNLDEHLSWLLSAKPSLPPDTLSLPPVTASFPSISSTQIEEAIAQAPEPEPSDSAVIQRRPSVPQVNGREGIDMARTRTAPSSASRPHTSGAPRIPEASPSKTARPPSVQSTRPAMPVSRKMTTIRTPAVSRPPIMDEGIEIMDLTEGPSLDDTPQPPSCRPPVSNTSRKRKSDEFDRDNRTGVASSKKPALPEKLAFRPSQEIQEFVSIDALDSPDKQDVIPSEPPPPYSTMPAAKGPLHQPRPQTSVTRTPTVQRPPKRTVPDSEDEDEDDLVNFSVDSRKAQRPHVPMTPPVRKPAPARPAPIPEQDDDYQPLDDDDDGIDLSQPRIVYPKLNLPPVSPPQQSTVQQISANVSTPSQPIQSAVPPPTIGTQSATPESEESRALLKDFFNVPGEAYRHALQPIKRSEEKVIDQITQRVTDEMPDDPVLEDRLKDLELRGKALESLWIRRTEHKLLIEDRDRLKEVLKQTITRREPREPPTLAVRNAASKLRAFEDECLELLGKCEGDIREALHHASHVFTQKKVAVKSTQAPRQSTHEHEPVVPSSSRIAQTQLQPQMPPPDRLLSISKPSMPNQFAKSHSRTYEPTTNFNTMFHDDDFEDLDDSELQPGNNALFSNRMGTPPAPLDDEDEDEDFGIDEDDEMFDDIPHGDYGSTKRPVMAETSGNSQARPKSAKKSKATSSRDLEEQMRKNLSFPWSQEVLRALKERFKLKGFRRNQFEAINATLAGKDTFVLMPTGGGKSLCYQLPALITSGKTRGVTVVISPLVSLMEDQVQHLRKLGIQASLMNSETTQEERGWLFDAMRGDDVEEFVQLLYITPEMLSKSNAMKSCFNRLYQRNRLARLVIDEAHCVSQWGHDFRKDYKDIGKVRQNFPDVPVIALTATATQNVKVDTMHNLGINGCEVFATSFNRENLYYEVRMKGKGKEDLNAIVDLIKNKHRKETGVLYCLARATCESTAQFLRENGIKAAHYHAGMETAEKSQVQKAWQAGEYHVIVATIAFGMGIDKANVRYVIHHSIPKSLEGYYQETGRAGRDGKAAHCYLFYGYQDAGKLRQMIDKNEDASQEQKNRQHAMLRQMTQFCDNKSDCRRVQVLAYFSERFEPEDCNKKCDNCEHKGDYTEVDLTSYARKAINLVRKTASQNVTVLHCIDVFRGANTSKIRDLHHNDLDEYGAGEDLDRGDLERLFGRLLSENALQEHSVVNKTGFANTYVRLGSKCNDYQPGRLKLTLDISASPRKTTKAPAKKAKKAKKEKAKAPQLPLSTNVSSPVQAASKQNKVTKQTTIRPLHANGYGRDNFVVSDEEGHDYADSDSDGFVPVREGGQTFKRNNARELGPPITTDADLDKLNDAHRAVLDEFMEQAGKKVKAIQQKYDLKMVPFSNTILRQMAIGFTDTEDKMLRIRGIDRERVKLYGKQFCKIVQMIHHRYLEMMGERDEDNTADQHAKNVIDLVTEDEEGSLYSGSEDGGGGDDGTGEKSQYFGNRDQPVNPKVAEFNRKFQESQSAGMRIQPSQSQTKRSPKGRKPRNYNIKSKGNRKASGYRGPLSGYGSGSGSGSGAGVKKKVARKNTQTAAAGSSHSSNLSIFAMPT